METKLSPKRVEFKFNEYLNKGFELFKKDMGTFIVAFIFMMILSLIPFCSFLAIGNFLKICRKINQGQQTSASEIFDFEDFWIYLKLFGILILGVVVLETPIFFFIPKDNGDTPSAFFFLYLIAFMVVIFYITLKAYYIVSLISLERVKSIKEAWEISKVMSSNNLFMIFLFSIVVSFIGQLGILACFMGLIFTVPLTYVLQYVSYEDGLQQIKINETEEIGNVAE